MVVLTEDKMAQQLPSTAFVDAFNDYFYSLPEKKKNKRSILSRIDVNNPPTLESIQGSMEAIETKNANKPSMKIMKKVMSPVIRVLKDYYGVIDTLAQADPTAALIVWGAVKVVIDGLSRCVDLFDKIKSELLSLRTQLERLMLYENLYGESSLMQQHLFMSYKNVFRFWSRVDKECDRCSLNILLRAAASFSVKKLQGIVDDLKEDANRMDRLVPIVEGRIARGEREDAEKERVEAGLERLENKQERKEASAWRKQQQSDRIRSWLGGQALNESNSRRHYDNTNSRFGNSCDWLLSASIFKDWVNRASKQPVVWLYAGPGSGKSVLCSHAVDHVKSLETKPAVAFQFYDFDDPQRTALQTARNLAAQLFEHIWLRLQDIPDTLHAQTQKNSGDLVNVLDFIRLLVGNLPNVYIFLDGLDEESTVARWKEASKIVDFVMELANSSPSAMRVWFSTQDRSCIRERLDAFPTLNIKDQVQTDVNIYLSQTVPGLDNMEVGDDTRNWILGELKNRANGNFLWASLMIKTLKDEVACFDDMEQFIQDGLPKDLDEYYKRIFSRYEVKERDLASKIFALVAFSKRRLRFRELQEAIGMVSTNTPELLKDRNIPWKQSVRKLFAPLIETQQDPEDPEDCVCYLFHSTVKDFLLKNDQIFLQGQPDTEGGKSRLITEFTIANACLLYLSQHRFSKLLVKKGVSSSSCSNPRSDLWTTSLGESTEEHHLLRYSAKYWDKHLDNVEGTQEVAQRVKDFLRSTNYQTTIQVQSLWVQSHFELHLLLDGHGAYLNYRGSKRVFPRWFSSHSSIDCGKYTGDYTDFVNEWRHLLNFGSCDCDECGVVAHGAVEAYVGEVDRCFWGALGPQNFLSSNHERYNSFRLTPEEGHGIERVGPLYEAVASDGSEIRLMRLAEDNSVDGATLRFHCEVWGLPNGASPRLLRTKTIATTSAATNWTSYGIASEEKRKRFGSPEAISFSPDMNYLRIGSQILSKDSRGDYAKIAGLDATAGCSPVYFEELTGRGPYVVLATRRRVPEVIVNQNRSEDQKVKDIGTDLVVEDKVDFNLGRDSALSDSHDSVGKLSKSDNGSDTSSQQSPAEDSSEEEGNGSESDESLEYDSADESWSEGSTEPDQDDPMPWDQSDISEDEKSDMNAEDGADADGEDDEDEDSSDDVVHSYKHLREVSDTDGEEITFDSGSDDNAYVELDDDYDSNSDGGYAFTQSDLNSDGEGPIPRYRAPQPRRTRSKAHAQQGSLMVYDLSSSNAIQVFKYTHPLPVMLYGSPPAIHPSKPLVVWPLCSGDILFADFESQTHFIRRAKPSTRKTRHIFIKCHFSSCGSFLHVASLEARSKTVSENEKRSDTREPLIMTAFISTHRLSARKTSRSPPTMIHRVKVSLGESVSFSGSTMPVNLTWSATNVYLSRSSDDNLLNVFRVSLFEAAKPVKGETTTEHPVSVPRQPIFMPESARSREIRYFPPPADDDCGMIIIGSGSVRRAWQPHSPATCKRCGDEKAKNALVKYSPPTGLYVKEDADLGGWSLSDAVVEMKSNSADGQLKRKMERFDAEDDCDFELYFLPD